MTTYTRYGKPQSALRHAIREYPGNGPGSTLDGIPAGKFKKPGPAQATDIEDVAPFIRHLASEGWWTTGRTILINGGHTTK